MPELRLPDPLRQTLTDTDHGRGEREEPLTPEDTAAPSHAERARTLIAARRVGTLGTISLDPPGFPYGSFVTFALDGPDPVFLVSKLATHTKHLEADPRASLLVAEEGASDPLANGRVTLVGPCERVVDPSRAREVFLDAHPSAAHYVDFTDFGFFRLQVASLRYIGGYGRMSWVDVDAWRAARPDPLAPDAEGILEHMNADHAEALRLYARAFTRAAAAERVAMTAVDRLGFELSVETERGPRPARVAFEASVESAEQARAALVALVQKARAVLEG